MLIVLSNLIFPRGRMDIHKNARLTLHGREALVKNIIQRGSTWNAAAAAFHVSARTAAKWVRRYEHACPGDLLHLDIKKLGRFGCVGHRIHGVRARHVRNGGWEYVHVAIDDHSRIAFSQVAPNEQGPSAAAFLEAALAWYARLNIPVRRVLTDNGPCYQSRAFRQVCQSHGIKHIRTRPYTPRTNGKAERFIQTALREWAYGCAYPTSEERAAHLPRWLHDYNWHRPHASLGGAPPISRSGLDRNNVLIHDN